MKFPLQLQNSLFSIDFHRTVPLSPKTPAHSEWNLFSIGIQTKLH